MSTISDDYSPEQTLTIFENPIPLLRHPIPSIQNNSLTLSFPNPKSWSTAYNSCESNILNQCTSGARIACSVTASKNCAPAWWKIKIKTKTKTQSQIDLIQRQNCEDREMEDCMERSRISCRKFAEDKCWPAFKDAKVVVVESGWKDREVRECVVGLVCKVWFGGRKVGGVEMGRLDGSWSRVKARLGFRVVRGSDLLEEKI